MMRTIITLSVVGAAAGAAVVAVQLNVFSPPAPIAVTPPPVEDPASAELLKRLERMDEERDRAEAAAHADHEALRKRLEQGGGESQTDPLNW